MEEPAVIVALNYSDSFCKHFVKFQKKVNKMSRTSQGRFVLGKTVPSVLGITLGLRPRAVSKTSGTVLPNTALSACK